MEREHTQIIWDHMHIRTSNVEDDARWFEEILGANIIRSPGRVDVEIGGARIFLAPATAEDKVHSPPSHPHLGLDHFGFSVVGLASLVDTLRTKGVIFTSDFRQVRPGVSACFIQGPQGISIELVERTPATILA